MELGREVLRPLRCFRRVQQAVLVLRLLLFPDNLAEAPVSHVLARLDWDACTHPHQGQDRKASALDTSCPSSGVPGCWRFQGHLWAPPHTLWVLEAPPVLLHVSLSPPGPQVTTAPGQVTAQPSSQPGRQTAVALSRPSERQGWRPCGAFRI